jgi:hypothetical protein
MGRDAAHEDDEDEKRKRHCFKRVPTRNGDAGALIYPDLASRFQNINVLGFSQQMFVMEKPASKSYGYSASRFSIIGDKHVVMLVCVKRLPHAYV